MNDATKKIPLLSHALPNPYPLLVVLFFLISQEKIDTGHTSM